MDTYRHADFVPSALSQAVYRKAGLLRRLWRYGKRGVRAHKISLLIGLGVNLLTIGMMTIRDLYMASLSEVGHDLVKTIGVWLVVCAVMSVVLGALAFHYRMRKRARRQENLPKIVEAVQSFRDKAPSASIHAEFEDATVTVGKSGQLKVRVTSSPPKSPLREDVTEDFDDYSPEFRKLYHRLKKLAHDDAKLAVLRTYPLSSMSTATAARLLRAFTFDDDKAKALKILKPHMFDVYEHGYEVEEAFTHGSGVEEAMRVIRS